MLFCTAAHAHEGTAFGQGFLSDAQGEVSGYYGNFGIILQNEDGSFGWTAEELVPAVPRWVHALEEGGLLAGTSFGLYRSDDKGCNWRLVGGELADARASVSSFAQGAEGPDHLFIVTSSSVAFGDGPLLNGMWESKNGGDTWRLVGLRSEDNRRYDQLWYMETLEQYLVVGRNAEGGYAIFRGAPDQGFSRVDASLAGDTLVRILDVRVPAAGDFEQSTVFLTVIREQTPTLLRSTDGLSTLVELQRFPTDETGVLALERLVRFEGETLLATNPGMLFRKSGSEYLPDADAPGYCLAPSVESNALWACGEVDASGGSPFWRTSDGTAWSPMVDIQDFCLRACPRSSEAEIVSADFNAEAWEGLVQNLDIEEPSLCATDDSPPAPTTSKKRGCAASAESVPFPRFGLAALASFFALKSLRRRLQ